MELAERTDPPQKWKSSLFLLKLTWKINFYQHHCLWDHLLRCHHHHCASPARGCYEAQPPRRLQLHPLAWIQWGVRTKYVGIWRNMCIVLYFMILQLHPLARIRWFLSMGECGNMREYGHGLKFHDLMILQLHPLAWIRWGLNMGIWATMLNVRKIGENDKDSGGQL